jgi:site-specific DNA-cytosine methylase
VDHDDGALIESKSRSTSAKDRIRLAGNAVTPPVMTWLVGRIVRALEEAK